MSDELGIDPKGDAGSKKAPLHFIPSAPLHEAAWVLKLGADKYGPFNWRHNRVKASVYRAAMGRHLDQWFDGLEDMDEESSRSHLAHVISSAMIVLDAMKHGTLVDDRPRAGVAGPVLSAEEQKAVREKIAETFNLGPPHKEEELRLPGRPWTPGTKVFLDSGESFEVPEPPHGYPNIEVLPPGNAPKPEDLAIFWNDGYLSSSWAKYDHYGSHGTSNFTWVVARGPSQTT